MKARPVTGVTSTALERKKWRYACRLFGTYNLKEGAMRRLDPLACNDRSWAAASAPKDLLESGGSCGSATVVAHARMDTTIMDFYVVRAEVL
jgi:hypothetical protein